MTPFQPTQPAMAAQQLSVLGGRVGSPSSGAVAIPEGKRIVYLTAPGEYRAERRTPKATEVATCTHDANGASAPRYGAQFLAVQQCKSVTVAPVWPGTNRRHDNRDGEARSGTCRRELG